MRCGHFDDMKAHIEDERTPCPACEAYEYAENKTAGDALKKIDELSKEVLRLRAELSESRAQIDIMRQLFYDIDAAITYESEEKAKAGKNGLPIDIVKRIVCIMFPIKKGGAA